MYGMLNRASREGGVEIRRRDGQAFWVRPAARSGSPLDVPGIDARNRMFTKSGRLPC